jgi:hypothetical protein
VNQFFVAGILAIVGTGPRTDMVAAAREMAMLQGQWRIIEIKDSGKVAIACPTDGAQILVNGHQVTLGKELGTSFSIELRSSRNSIRLRSAYDDWHRGPPFWFLPYEFTGNQLRVFSENGNAYFLFERVPTGP